MTNHEAYVFGWVFGRICTEAPNKNIGIDVSTAALRPYSASAIAISNANRLNILKGDLDRQVCEALCEIDSIDPPTENGLEIAQPIDIQGSWQIGYYAGRSKRPLQTAKFNISASRKAKKMTQAQLAEQMGVDQPVISRWESGKTNPTDENLKKLKEILS